MKFKVFFLCIMSLLTFSLAAQEFDAEKLLTSAEAGDPESQLILGTDYISGEHLQIDLAKGFYWISQAASQGNVEALYQKGLCHIIGMGTSQDIEQGVNDITASASAGYVTAQGCLGHMFYKGFAMEYYTDLMQHSMFQPLFYHYIIQQDALVIDHQDIPFEQNDTKALYWLNQAADNGDTYSMLTLSNIYRNGKCGLEPDEHSYMEYLMSSAELGNTQAQKGLALCYRDGDGVEPDEDKYMEWLIRSAQGGNIFSKVMWGNEFADSGQYDDAVNQYMSVYSLSHPEYELYDYIENEVRIIINEGKCSEEMQDSVIEYVRYEAEAGNTASQLFLGHLYASNNIQEYKKAVYWYKKALDAGHEEANAELADLYMKESSPLFDPSIGVEYVKASAEAGSSVAQYNLGKGYCLGDWGLPADLDKGVELISASALQGYITAMNTGGFIICGQADEVKDKKKRKEYATIGVRLLEMGIENGDSLSAWRLSLVYSVGAGVPVSMKMAYHYRVLAAQMGNEQAIEHCRKSNIQY